MTAVVLRALAFVVGVLDRFLAPEPSTWQSASYGLGPINSRAGALQSPVGSPGAGSSSPDPSPSPVGLGAGGHQP